MNILDTLSIILLCLAYVLPMSEAYSSFSENNNVFEETNVNVVYDEKNFSTRIRYDVCIKVS